MATAINSIGLIFDIIGALLLFKFGLPAKVSPEGHIYRVLAQVDEAEIALGKCYRRWSNIALVLLVLGFLGQLVSNFIH